VQVRPPDVADPLACNTLGAILTANSILLQLSTVGEAHTRLVAIQASPSAGPANVGRGPETAAQAAAYAACI
jgi:hypothetical protein